MASLFQTARRKQLGRHRRNRLIQFERLEDRRLLTGITPNDPLFSEQWASHGNDGYVEVDGDTVRLTKDGLLVVDGLLPAFFEPEFQGVRYT